MSERHLNTMASPVTLGLCALALLTSGLGSGCGRLLDGEDREPFGTYGDAEQGNEDNGEDPQSGGEISEGCYDGVLEPGETCQVQEPEDRPAGIDPCSLSVADFDVDGRPDLAVPNSDPYIPPGGTHVANVLRGFGNGDFAEATPYPAGAALPVGLAVGDFDGDGMTDVATANHEAEAVYVLPNDGGAGSMGFGDPDGVTVGSTASSVAAADFSGDGIDDLVVNTPAGVSLLLGSPNGPVWIDTIDVGAMPMHSALADLDADGLVDLATVVADGFESELLVFHGAGEGSFAEVNRIMLAGSPQWVAVADLNMDGDLDLIVSEQGPDQFSIFAGSGHGGFAEAWSYPVCAGPQAVAVGDMNNDGATDVVVGCADSDRVEMHLQRADGVFELARWWGTGSRPVSVQVADLNLDGQLDIAWANQFSNTVGLVMSHI